MLDFRPLTMERRDELLPYYHAFCGNSCQHSFVSSFCMRGKYGDQTAIRDGALYTLRASSGDANSRVYLFPLCDLSDDAAAGSAVENVLADARAHGCLVRFETILSGAAETLERLFPGRFAIREERDYSEYLYTYEKLALLPGHEMASKRHDLNTFERDYGGRYTVRRIETAEQLDAIRQFHEPYPYFRGLVSEIGLKRAEVHFVQDRRKHGRTKNNFFTLYDMAMTGLVNHSKLPLRMAVYVGFFTGFASFLIAMTYLVMKLIYWDKFSVGMAPIMIGMFFLASVQLIFIGIIGEYIGAIWTQGKDRPLVIEEEKINFD